MDKPLVVVVGSSNTDLVVAVSRIPAPGETVLGGALQVLPGGKGANQAVACARLGGQVTFVARVGDDDYGRQAIAGYAADGIETRFVTPTPGVASGVALIPVETGTGQNAIVVAPGANSCLDATDIERAAPALRAAAIVVVSLEIPDAAVEAAIAIAFEAGVPVLLNPAPARPLADTLLARIAILTPNETEAEQLTGEADLARAAAALRAQGVGAVVATLGAEGALVHDAAGLRRVPAFAVSPVDTVAAGDCFTGALAVERAAGTGLDAAVRFACAAAAVKVTRPGAQPGIPSRGEVDAFLAIR